MARVQIQIRYTVHLILHKEPNVKMFYKDTSGNFTLCDHKCQKI